MSANGRATDDAIGELADAIERTLRAEHVFVAAADPGPLVAALWERAMRAAPAPGAAAGEAYDLVVALAEAGLESLPETVAARAETLLIVRSDAAREPGASLLATLERCSERGFEIDPLVELPLSGARALLLRRAARPLPADVRRAYARLLNRSTPERERETAALRERLAVLERETARLRSLADLERSDRLRAEADLERVVGALATANDALAAQLASARAARIALDRDIQALAASPLWRLKVAVARRLGRGAR